MVARVLELFGGRVLGEGDFEDSEETFLPDCEESFFSRLPDINNFAFGDVHDLVKAFYLPAKDFCNPESFIHKALCSLDGDEALAFTKKESESPGNILA